MLEIDKNHPSPGWMESLRLRFPVEQEMERMLGRKLAQRSGPPFVPVSLERMCECFSALLQAKLSGPFEIHGSRWLSGGASKLQVALDLTWRTDDGQTMHSSLVIRMEPAESIVETSRLREFEIIRAVQGLVPVPQVYWIDAIGEYFPYPAIVYGFAQGVTKPSKTSSNVTGLGTNFGPELRAPLGDQFIEHLAKLHTWDWRSADLGSLDVPRPGTEAIEWQLNLWERIWEEDSNRDIPLIQLAAAWLRENMPSTQRLSLIHGDYRAGNFLFDETSQRITAWLDWELGHLGDFHEDLAYTTLPYLGHFSEDGRTALASGLLPEPEMYERYERHSGFRVDPKTLNYYQVFHAWRSVIIVVGSSYRPARNAKTHQDLLLTWIMGLSYPILSYLRC